jgi:hypothetical protein
MSTIKSSDEHLTLNADGSSKDIKFQANGVEKASISSSGAFTSTTIDATKLTGALPAISGAALTGVGVSGISSSADATAITIDSSENVGIGETVPLARLHVKEGDSGVSSISANFDQLILEDDAHCGMHILGGTSSDCAIYFGDSGNSGAGQLKYSHADDDLYFSNPNGEKFRITSDGRGKSKFTAHAWATWNGSGNTLTDSFNVSSINDAATGDDILTFANAMNNNKVIMAACSGDVDDHVAFRSYSAFPPTTTTVRFGTQNNSGSYADREGTTLVFFGDS